MKPSDANMLEIFLHEALLSFRAITTIRLSMRGVVLRFLLQLPTLLFFKFSFCIFFFICVIVAVDTPNFLQYLPASMKFLPEELKFDPSSEGLNHSLIPYALND